MEAGADVEIDYHLRGGATISHYAFVSSITVHRNDNGKITGYTVTTLDDAQGDDNKQNNKNTLPFDANGNQVGGAAGARCITFVVAQFEPLDKK